jgi:hypothetical protein
MATWRYTGDDIAAAFNRPLPSTKCATCRHRRADHRREIDTTSGDIFHMPEAHFECQEFDGRTITGNCKCTGFVEPARAGHPVA